MLRINWIYRLRFILSEVHPSFSDISAFSNPKNSIFYLLKSTISLPFSQRPTAIDDAQTRGAKKKVNLERYILV